MQTLTSTPQRLAIKDGNRFILLPLNDIIRIESAGNYVLVKTPKTAFLYRQTMHWMEERLGANGFLRISRSCLVNITYVTEFRFEKRGTYAVMFDDGSKLLTSRRYRPAIEQWLENLS